jgi:hypothetical protein
MSQDREPEMLRRRQALKRLGLAATVIYATPIVASVKVYAGNTVSPSKHGASQPNNTGTGSTGSNGGTKKP